MALCASIDPALSAKALPAKVGDCALTRIVELSHRLGDRATSKPIMDSGSDVTFADKLHQVSYDELPEIGHSRAGDRVLICLVSIPQHCPKGDHRGKIYTTTNLRTRQSWTLPDSEHFCGGA
ncbi:MAG TPA: hypothetical protein VKT24_04160 [Rhizomicrobium sp.]|nr:hypothetical protein [Rhizomicrobium sp.]